MAPIFDHDHLRLFIVLARLLNMRRASSELGLSASGISRALAALERSWACRLFERTPQRLVLTAAGRELLPLAESALDRLNLLHGQLQNATGAASVARPLRIGVPSAFARIALPGVLREFVNSCPDRPVSISLGAGPEMEDRLREAQVDLAIGLRPAGSESLLFEELAQDELVFVLHPLHPWAVERRVELTPPAPCRLILPGEDDETRALITHYFREEGISVLPDIEVTDEGAIKELVRLNLGVAVLPRWVASDDIARGELATLPVGRRRLRRQWGLLRRRSRTLDFSEDLFGRICGAVLRECVDTSAASSPHS